MYKHALARFGGVCWIFFLAACVRAGHQYSGIRLRVADPGSFTRLSHSCARRAELGLPLPFSTLLFAWDSAEPEAARTRAHARHPCFRTSPAMASAACSVSIARRGYPSPQFDRSGTAGTRLVLLPQMRLRGGGACLGACMGRAAAHCTAASSFHVVLDDSINFSIDKLSWEAFPCVARAAELSFNCGACAAATGGGPRPLEGQSAVEWGGIAAETRPTTHNTRRDGAPALHRSAAAPHRLRLRPSTAPASAPAATPSSAAPASASPAPAAACPSCGRTAPSSSKFRRRRRCQRPCRPVLARHLARNTAVLCIRTACTAGTEPRRVCAKEGVGPSCVHAAARRAGQPCIAAEGARCPPLRRRHHELPLQQEAPRARGPGQANQGGAAQAGGHRQQGHGQGRGRRAMLGRSRRQEHAVTAVCTLPPP